MLCCKIRRNLHFFALVSLSPTYFSTVDSCRLWTMTETLQDARPPRQLHATCRGKHSTHFFSSDGNISPELVLSFVLILREFTHIGILCTSS